MRPMRRDRREAREERRSEEELPPLRLFSNSPLARGGKGNREAGGLLVDGWVQPRREESSPEGFCGFVDGDWVVEGGEEVDVVVGMGFTALF